MHQRAHVVGTMRAGVIRMSRGPRRDRYDRRTCWLKDRNHVLDRDQIGVLGRVARVAGQYPSRIFHIP